MLNLITNPGVSYTFMDPVCYPAFESLSTDGQCDFTFSRWVKINSLSTPYNDPDAVDDFICMKGSIHDNITEAVYRAYIQRQRSECTVDQDIVKYKFSRPERSKIKKEQTQKIFECDEVLIRKPLSHKSCIVYGYGTKWCISSSRSDYYYNLYSQNADIYILLPKNMKPPYSKILLIMFRTGKFCLFDELGCIINDGKILDINGKTLDIDKLSKIKHIFTPLVVDKIYQHASI